MVTVTGERSPVAVQLGRRGLEWKVKTLLSSQSQLSGRETGSPACVTRVLLLPRRILRSFSLKRRSGTRNTQAAWHRTRRREEIKGGEESDLSCILATWETERHDPFCRFFPLLTVSSDDDDTA
jgi:hypothetical protein